MSAVAGLAAAACGSPHQQSRPVGSAEPAAAAQREGLPHAAVLAPPQAAKPDEHAIPAQSSPAASSDDHEGQAADTTTAPTTPRRHAKPHDHPAPHPEPVLPAPVAPAPAPPEPEAESQSHLPNHANAPDIGYELAADSHSQLEAALAAARADGKAVLVDFGANWCAMCYVLAQTMHTRDVQNVLAANYHVVQIDLGNGSASHMRIADRYAIYGTYGMPLLVVLAPDGSVRANTAKGGEPKFDEPSFAAFLRQWAR